MTMRALFARNREIRRRGPPERDYTGVMDIRRATYGAAVRLAMVFSAMAAIVALTLDAMGDVSAAGLVVAVMVVGFTTSWVQTGRIARTVGAGRSHRVTVMPLHHPVG